MLKKLLTYICMFLVAGIGFFGISNGNFHSAGSLVLGTQVFADSCDGPNPPAPCLGAQNSQDKIMQETYNKLVGGLNIFLAVITIIVSPAIMLAGWLMSPDWTSGDLFGIRPVLHSLWVLVANVTYFIYAVLLIFIALATIFNSDKYGYKQLLPRLALGILLVPLTWWFIQFIISLSSIVTASVMNIPAEALQKHMSTQQTQGGKSWWDKKVIPKTIEYNNESNSLKKNIETVKCTDSTCLSPSEMLTDSSGMYGALLVYGYGVFKFSEIKELNTWTDGVKSIFSLINQGIIAVVMFLVFGLLVMALIFMLLLRAIKLWFYAIFSPLMTLKYVFKDGGLFGKENSDSFDFKEFIGLAFVPALVGMSLSFGLIVISLLQTSGGSNDGNCTPSQLTGEGCKIIGIMGNPKNEIIRKLEPIESSDSGDGNFSYSSVNITRIGGMSYRYVGSVVKSEDFGAALGEVNSAQSVLSSAGGIFGTIIIDIIALMFIWLAFMAAKNVSKVATTAFAPFEKFGKQMAGTIKYTPIPFTGGMSAASIEKIGGRLAELPQEANNKRLKESNIGKRLGMNGVTDDIGFKKINDRVSSNAEESVRDNGNMAKENMQIAIQNGEKNIQSSDTIDKLMKAYKDIHGSELKIKDALNNNGMDAETATKMASKIYAGKTTSDSEVVKLWAEAAKKGMINKSDGTSSGFTAELIDKAGGKELKMKIGNITIEMPRDKITADDISKKILENKDVKRIPESDLDTQLKGLGADLLSKIKTKLRDEKYFEAKKEEPKKP